MTRTLTEAECWAFCETMLPAVSRSFALIIPCCPPPIDRAMCVAYLMCRIADTIEDEPSLEDGRRQALYDVLLETVDRPDEPLLASRFVASWPAMPADEYGALIRGCDRVFSVFAALPDQARLAIRTCVREMVAGMRAVTPVEVQGGVTYICADIDGLDRYCHHVAGTVGLMSTELFLARLAPAGFEPSASWRENGRRMGLGLQMTNIIKDCRVDAERGVSFIPRRYVDALQATYNLSPTGRAELLRHTVGHLDAAMSYIREVPADETGIRTFLLGSVLPAIATLEVAARGTELHPKIDRAKMSEIFECIQANVGDNNALCAWYDQHKQRVLSG